jgi:putrescine transport system permease protein
MVAFRSTPPGLTTVGTAQSPTLKWYYALLNNEEILDAAWISFEGGGHRASGAVILGTLASAVWPIQPVSQSIYLECDDNGALGHARVITGLSLLLLFVALGQLIGWPAGRRHHHDHRSPTFSMAYVTVIVVAFGEL